jgi:hypothetical protein
LKYLPRPRVLSRRRVAGTMTTGFRTKEGWSFAIEYKRLHISDTVRVLYIKLTFGYQEIL